MQEKIYLDNNATTPLDPEVFAAMYQLKSHPSNPSSVHHYGREAKALLQKARAEIADYLQKDPNEILFTSSATEAINYVIRGLLSADPQAEVISSNIEHSATFATLSEFHQKGQKVTLIPATLKGAPSPHLIEESISDKTRLLAFSYANSETGVKADIEAIAKIAKKYSIPLLLDGVAIMGKEPFEIFDGVSAACFSAHKFHGPKGSGFAYVDPKLSLPPLITGGGQERNRRGGTENLEAILGTAKAVTLLEYYLPEKMHYIKDLRDRFEQSLLDRLPNLIINGEGERVVNTSNISFPGIDGETLLMILDQQGICASHGSACSAGALEPSRVLQEMGITKKRARSSIRFSFSRMNTREEVDMAAETVISFVQQLCS